MSNVCLVETMHISYPKTSAKHFLLWISLEWFYTIVLEKKKDDHEWTYRSANELMLFVLVIKVQLLKPRAGKRIILGSSIERLLG